MSVATFREWCSRYGCSHGLYIGSLDFSHHRTTWDQSKLWDGADLNRTFLAEFGFIATGNASALPPGADPVLLSKDTAASNHESGQMAQLSLNMVLGPAAFGLPLAYRFTIWDGQAAVTLEDPHQQGLCLWDGVLRALIQAKAPQRPPAPPVTPPLVVPPASVQGLPPLAPAAVRIEELRLLASTTLSLTSLPLPGSQVVIFLGLLTDASWPRLKPTAIALLKAVRKARQMRGDPRPLPLEDL